MFGIDTFEPPYMLLGPACILAFFLVTFVIVLCQQFASEEQKDSTDSVGVCKSASANPSLPANDNPQSQGKIEHLVSNLDKTCNNLEGKPYSPASCIDSNQRQKQNKPKKFLVCGIDL